VGLVDMGQQGQEGNITAYREEEASDTLNFMICWISFCSLSIADVFITCLHINFILKITLNDVKEMSTFDSLDYRETLLI
jgi:hypothetical protein